MHLQYAFIAESVVRNKYGAFNARGIGLSIVRSNMVPFVQPKFVIALALMLDPDELGREHEVAVTMLCPDRSYKGDIVRSPLRRDPIPGDIRPHWYENLIFVLRETPIPVTGTYEVRILLDGRHAHSLYFEVIWDALDDR